MDRIERAVTNGEVLLLENIMENVDPVLEPLLGNYGINAKRPSLARAREKILKGSEVKHCALCTVRCVWPEQNYRDQSSQFKHLFLLFFS